MCQLKRGGHGERRRLRALALCSIVLAPTVGALACRNQVDSCDSALLAGPSYTAFSTPPRLLDRADVLFDLKKGLRSAGVQEHQELDFFEIESLIGRDGRVVLAQVKPSTGNSELDSTIVSVARTIRYEPAFLDGSPVCFWLAFPGPRVWP